MCSNNDLEEAKQALLNSFPNSFINEHNEFIAERRSNQYFLLNDCNSPRDIECKVLEWLSRPASKGQPYSQEWRNRKFREFMLNGINAFLDTGFSEDEMRTIYQHLGNAINHDKTILFIESGYDFHSLQSKELSHE